MGIRVRAFLVIFIASGALSTASSQQGAGRTSRKTAVYLECPATDSVGRTLCFRVREEIRKSAAFESVLTAEGAFVRLRIHSVDRDTPPLGVASAVAVILTLASSDSYLHHQVWYVGSNKVESAAIGIVAGVDEYVEQLFRDAARGRGRGGL